MSEGHKTDSSGASEAASSGVAANATRVLHRVMLTGVRREIETPDSFAIKFSILAKAPLPKVKQLMRSLPVALWTGASKAKAAQILELVEEAGGIGEIVQTSAVERRPAEKPKSAEASCPCCGFPIKEGETRCDFCRTVVGQSATEKVHWSPPKKRKGIPRARLILYLCILALGVLFLIVLR